MATIFNGGLLMNTRNNLLASIGICAALGVASAWGQGEPSRSESGMAMSEMAVPPAPQNYSGVEVINGGADLDQADAIERIQSRYPLRVEISGKGGAYYVADRVRVLQRGEVVAEIPDAGPWLLINVPPGRYTLEGDFGGTELRRDVLVPTNNSVKVSWIVPASVE
jgi:hypothetical protein